MTSSASELMAELRASIGDERVLHAIGEVPRDAFVPLALRPRAWENVSLPIADDQTISQPLVVARMCELLELTGEETVLDVGTGSGYHAAILARLAARVYSIERHPSLSAGARRALDLAGVDNVTLLTGDGTLGHPDVGAFDAINVAARGESVPPRLVAQLAPAGRLVMPLQRRTQRLVRMRRVADRIEQQSFERVSFVALVVGRTGAPRD